MHGKTVTWFVLYPLLMIRQSHQRLSGSIGVRRWRFCIQLSSKSTTNAWVEWKDWPRSRTAYPTASTRWWVYLFWYLFDIAVSNAFILMRDSQAHQRFTRSGKRKMLKIVKFRRNLICVIDNVWRREAWSSNLKPKCQGFDKISVIQNGWHPVFLKLSIVNVISLCVS